MEAIGVQTPNVGIGVRYRLGSLSGLDIIRDLGIEVLTSRTYDADLRTLTQLIRCTMPSPKAPGNESDS